MKKFEISSTLGLRDFADLKKQPGFRQGVKLTTELERTAHIVEPYKIGPELIPCGLTCHQGHNKGYLLRLSDGSHTNVGHNCGKNHFNASDFEGQVRQFETKSRIDGYKIKINETIDRIPELNAKIEKYSLQAKPYQESLHNFHELYPDPIYDDLRDRAKRGQPEIFKTRRKQGAEKISNITTNAKGRQVNHSTDEFFQERVGSLNGLSIFSVLPQNHLKEASETLKSFERADGDFTEVKLRRYSKTGQIVDELLKRVELLFEDFPRFFNPNNFSQLPKLIEGRHQAELERIEWDFQTNTGRRLSVGQLKRARLKKAS